MRGQRRMEHLADPRMGRQEGRDAAGRGRAARVRGRGAVPTGGDGLGPPPVEHAAAHRQQVHRRVGQRRVARRDVAPQIAVGAAERLGAAGQHHVDALREQRRGEGPRRGDGRIDDQPQLRRSGAGGAHQGHERGHVLRAHQRVGERLGEHEPGLGPDSRGQRRVVAVVHDRDLSADALGQPLQVGPGLVVDLPQHHGVAARRHEHIEGHGGGLHAGIAHQHCPGRFERLHLVNERGRGRGAVARIEVRQFRPAARGGKEERRLGLLPRHGAGRAEEIELHRRLVRMQVGEPGAPRVCVEPLVQGPRRRGHRRQGRTFGGARPRVEPARHAAHS